MSRPSFIDRSQFYYASEVLGVSDIIKPRELHSIYRLQGRSKHSSFLFFCNQMKGEENLKMMRKMQEALEQKESQIVEISNVEHPYTRSYLFNNLLTRFYPRGFVIFGTHLAERLTGKSQAIGKISYPLPVKESGQSPLIPGCVLKPISEFMNSDPHLVIEVKKQAWKQLKLAFPISI